MVYPNTPPQEVTHTSDLRQPPVAALESAQCLLYRNVHLALLHTRAEVCVHERCRILLTSLLREREDDDWEQGLLPEVPQEVDVEVLVCGGVYGTWRSTTTTSPPSWWS